jgi:hypothetical protein
MMAVGWREGEGGVNIMCEIRMSALGVPIIHVVLQEARILPGHFTGQTITSSEYATYSITIKIHLSFISDKKTSTKAV